eukprot:2487873-Prymnesium_polylepis.1
MGVTDCNLDGVPVAARRPVRRRLDVVHTPETARSRALVAGTRGAAKPKGAATPEEGAATEEEEGCPAIHHLTRRCVSAAGVGGGSPRARASHPAAVTPARDHGTLPGYA